MLALCCVYILFFLPLVLSLYLQFKSGVSLLRPFYKGYEYSDYSKETMGDKKQRERQHVIQHFYGKLILKNLVSWRTKAQNGCRYSSNLCTEFAFVILSKL